jgi:hypothetical protein
MKAKILALGLLFISGTAFSDGGNSVGNGGDGYAIAFVQTGRNVLKLVEAKSEAERYGVSPALLESAVEKIHVESVSGPLFKAAEQVDALNFPDEGKIIFSRTGWDAMSDGRKKVLVLHEYLGILRMNDSSYQISLKVLGSEGDLQMFGKEEWNFAYLINHYTQATPKRPVWIGYWWPFKEDGIASQTHDGGISPVEKYELATGGRGDATQWERKVHGKNIPGMKGFWGHETGWTNASILFPEPVSPVTVNGVTFTVADIKALLSEISIDAVGDTFGIPVTPLNEDDKDARDDVTPDQYFHVLTHYLGKLGTSVAIDRYTGDQLWAQPLAGYRFDYPRPEDYLGEDQNHPGVYRIRVTSTIWWVNDEVDASQLTPEFDFSPVDTDFFASRKLPMELWLDGPVVFGNDGRIVSSGNLIETKKGDSVLGGHWLIESTFNDSHPDTMWVPKILKRPDVDTTARNPFLNADWIVRKLVK